MKRYWILEKKEIHWDGSYDYHPVGVARSFEDALDWCKKDWGNRDFLDVPELLKYSDSIEEVPN